MFYVKEKEAEMTVKSTKDLSIFKMVKGNRVPNPKHIDYLCKSIEKNGLLLCPIIVNEHNEVIDGQHRLLAAKKMKCAIYYIVAKGYNVQHVQALNVNQKNWSLMDYVHSYAEQGLNDYVLFKRFTERFNTLPVTVCLAICFQINSNNGESYTSKVKNGEFKFKNYDSSVLVAEKILKISAYYENYSNRTFVLALLKCLSNERFSFNEFLDKLKIQPTALVDCVTSSQALDLIESIYNYKRREKVSLRY